LSERSSRASWPVAAALVAFVVALGALPHLRFSLLLGKATHFLSAYDEDLYAFWALAGGGPLLPHRFLSDAALRLLAASFGGSWGAALIAADLLFPAACAVVAWVLVGHVTRRRLPRLALALGLLFAQELFSLGCWTIWQLRDPLGIPSPDAVPLDLRAFRALLPEPLARLWPDYASPFLTLFRTPEPQISRILLLAALILALRVASGEEGRPALHRPLILAALLNALLGLTYFFQAVAIAGVEASFAAILWMLGRPRAARRVAVLAAIGLASVALGTLVYHVAPDAQARAFASRLPILSPSSLAALAGLAAAVVELRRGRRDALFALAVACLASVLVFTNQQLLTGRMVSVRDWERSVDYPLVFLAGSVLTASSVRRWRVSLPAVYGVLGALLALAGSALVTAQQRLFEEQYLARNLESVALQRAVEAVEARGVRPAVWALERPELSLLLQVRLQRRIPHLLEAADVFTQPIPPTTRAGGAWGSRSPFARRLFEHFARTVRAPAAIGRVLDLEADAGGGQYLTYLFALDEWWTAMTDGRALRRDAVRERIPEVRAAYAAYLEAGDPCWSRPAVVLTRQVASPRASARWDEDFLLETVVGPEDGPPLMNMNAFLQTPRGADGSTGAAIAVCD
jgi:hypothetical protein